MDKIEENYWRYEQMPEGTKPCPHCKTEMQAVFSSLVLISDPPQQRWYWSCDKCEHEELGGIHRHQATKTARAI